MQGLRFTENLQYLSFVMLFGGKADATNFKAVLLAHPE
jgi:hypothetical protein